MAGAEYSAAPTLLSSSRMICIIPHRAPSRQTSACLALHRVALSCDGVAVHRITSWRSAAQRATVNFDTARYDTAEPHATRCVNVVELAFHPRDSTISIIQSTSRCSLYRESLLPAKPKKAALKPLMAKVDFRAPQWPSVRCVAQCSHSSSSQPRISRVGVFGLPQLSEEAHPLGIRT